MATDIKDNATAREWLGQRLRESRKRLRLSAADVRAATGIAANTITAWEHGRVTELTEQVYAMAQLYGWPEGAIDRVLAGGMPHATEVPSELLGLSAEDARRYREEIAGSGDLSERTKRYLLKRLLDDAD